MAIEPHFQETTTNSQLSNRSKVDMWPASIFGLWKSYKMTLDKIKMRLKKERKYSLYLLHFTIDKNRVTNLIIGRCLQFFGTWQSLERIFLCYRSSNGWRKRMAIWPNYWYTPWLENAWTNVIPTEVQKKFCLKSSNTDCIVVRFSPLHSSCTCWIVI